MAGRVAMLLAWVLALPSFAADVSAEFDAANKLYDVGQFSAAATAYEHLIESGHTSPTLLFNLGNARFKAGEFGRAISAYRQAEQLAPRDPEIRANLQFVRSQVQGPTDTSAPWQRAIGWLTVNEWTLLASGALWLWLILLGSRQLRPGLKPALRSVVFASGLATVLLSGCLAAAWSARSNPIAIVTTAEAIVRHGPQDASPMLYTARDGAELKVVDEKAGWLQVTVAGQRIGWVRHDRVLLPDAALLPSASPPPPASHQQRGADHSRFSSASI